MRPLTDNILLDALKTGRHLGTITPENPIKAKRLIAALLVRYSVKTDAREIREFVEKLSDEGAQVCSTNRGYFYALTYEEMMIGVEYYDSYINAYLKRRTAMKRTAERLRDPDADLFGHPAVKQVEQEFGRVGP